MCFQISINLIANFDFNFIFKLVFENAFYHVFDMVMLEYFVNFILNLSLDLICYLNVNSLLDEVFASFTDKGVNLFLDHNLNVLLDMMTNFFLYDLFHLLHDLVIYDTHNLMVNSVLDLLINEDLETLDQVVLDRRRNLDTNEVIQLATHVNPDLVAMDHDHFGELILDAKFVFFELIGDFVIKTTSFLVYFFLHDVLQIIFQRLTSHIDGIVDLLIQVLAHLKVYLLLDQVLDGGGELVLDFMFEFGLKMGAYEFLDPRFDHTIVIRTDRNLDLVRKMLIYFEIYLVLDHHLELADNL